jgi:hypothetical protein
VPVIAERHAAADCKCPECLTIYVPSLLLLLLLLLQAPS